MSLISDTFRALAQMSDPRFLRVLVLGLGLTIALLAGATWLFAWIAGGLVPESFTLFGLTIDFAGGIASGAAVGLMLVASIFLMVPVASAFTGLFLDKPAK